MARFELTTSRTQTERSTRLSYTPSRRAIIHLQPSFGHMAGVCESDRREDLDTLLIEGGVTRITVKMR